MIAFKALASASVAFAAVTFALGICAKDYLLSAMMFLGGTLILFTLKREIDEHNRKT